MYFIIIRCGFTICLRKKQNITEYFQCGLRCQIENKIGNPLLRIADFWSGRQDLNLRLLAPKKLWELFSNNFRSFLAPFIPENLLFETLVSTVSMCSKPGYGQICGQAPVLRQNRGYAYFAMKCSTFLTWDIWTSQSVA